MLLYEAEGKRLLRDAGFEVPSGLLAMDANQAAEAANEIGFPCAVKAQTLSGKRWKRGLVAMAADEHELRDRIAAMGGDAIAGFLIERQIPRAAEFYVSVSIAEAEGNGVLLISAAGGVDVEEATSFVALPIFSRHAAPGSAEILEAIANAGINGRFAAPLADAAARLTQVVLAYECVLAEINPLFLADDGSVIAIDAKIELDDDARVQHHDILQLPRERDPLEMEAAAKGISFARLEGEIGTIVGGAGLAMLTIDALSDAGLKPANFIDLQGSSTQKFVAGFALLAKIGGLKGILTNNAGGLNPCLSLARGIVEGAHGIGSVPIVVKLHGADETEAWDYLAGSGLHNLHICKGTTADAVRQLWSLL